MDFLKLVGVHYPHYIDFEDITTKDCQKLLEFLRNESNFEIVLNGKPAFTTEYYRHERELVTPVQWASQFQQEPFEAKGLLFPENELNRYFELPVDQEPDAIISVCDTAEGGGDSVIEIERKVFLLSATEVGKPRLRTILTEGEALKYFFNNEQRIACFETGEAVPWWLRTPSVAHDNVVCGVGSNGIIGIGGVGTINGDEKNGVRPAFCMPADIPIYLGDDGYYILGNL